MDHPRYRAHNVRFTVVEPMGFFCGSRVIFNLTFISWFAAFILEMSRFITVEALDETFSGLIITVSVVVPVIWSILMARDAYFLFRLSYLCCPAKLILWLNFS